MEMKAVNFAKETDDRSTSENPVGPGMTGVLLRRLKSAFLCLCIVAPALHLHICLCSAQTVIKITGAVQDSLSSTPIPDALVYLLKTHLVDTTLTTGKFNLSGNPSFIKGNVNPVNHYAPVVQANNSFRFDLLEKENVTINTFSLYGRLLKREKTEWDAGTHVIRPYGRASGVSIVQVFVGKAFFSITSILQGAEGRVAHSQTYEPSEIFLSAKQAAIPAFYDTIVVMASGYDQRRFPVNKQVVSGLRIKCLKSTVIPIPVDTVVDIEGNVYKTVKIGTQTWMAENLKTTKFNDSVAIPQIADGDTWKNTTASGYCFYDNNAIWGKMYGVFYNWYAVDASNPHKLAPKGWHVATDPDWVALETFLGGWNVAGGKMKETGTSHWKSPNTGATNESGFNALPAGKRTEWTDLVNNVYLPAAFLDMEYAGWWWESTKPACRNIQQSDCAIFHSECSPFFGASVRCVKD
jgi:uncharacterized protein (TIGR02145 family)